MCCTSPFLNMLNFARFHQRNTKKLLEIFQRCSCAMVQRKCLRCTLNGSSNDRRLRISAISDIKLTLIVWCLGRDTNTSCSSNFFLSHAVMRKVNFFHVRRWNESVSTLNDAPFHRDFCLINFVSYIGNNDAFGNDKCRWSINETPSTQICAARIETSDKIYVLFSLQ